MTKAKLRSSRKIMSTHQSRARKGACGYPLGTRDKLNAEWVKYFRALTLSGLSRLGNPIQKKAA